MSISLEYAMEILKKNNYTIVGYTRKDGTSFYHVFSPEESCEKYEQEHDYTSRCVVDNKNHWDHFAVWDTIWDVGEKLYYP